jgi:hypothetical protein
MPTFTVAATAGSQWWNCRQNDKNRWGPGCSSPIGWHASKPILRVPCQRISAQRTCCCYCWRALPGTLKQLLPSRGSWTQGRLPSRSWGCCKGDPLLPASKANTGLLLLLLLLLVALPLGRVAVT